MVTLELTITKLDLEMIVQIYICKAVKLITLSKLNFYKTNKKNKRKENLDRENQYFKFQNQILNLLAKSIAIKSIKGIYKNNNVKQYQINFVKHRHKIIRIETERQKYNKIN